jgi:hypothetical protein
MGERDNVRTIEALYSAFGRGDLGAVLKTFAEDVDWQAPRLDDTARGGEGRGRDAVERFFITTHRHLEVQQFSPEEFAARDDQVMVLGHGRMRTRNGGQVFGTNWVHTFRLRRGKVVAFREYSEIATIAESSGTSDRVAC